MPLFSIIIPVFNDENNLTSAVESVLRQGCDDCELIIINDASTDNSGLAAKKHACQYPWIKVIHNESNLGVAESRNTALSVSTGNYIIFLDSDDMLMGDCLSGLAKIIEGQPDTELIVGRWVREHGEASNSRIFENPAVLQSNDPTSLIKHLNDINYLNYVCWHYVIKRKVLIEKQLRFLNVRIAEDQEFVARLLCSVASVSYFDQPMYLYRGTGRISRSMDLITSIGFIEIILSLGKFLQENRQLKAEHKEFIFSRMRSVNGMLSGRLSLLNNEEIENLEEYRKDAVQKCYELHDIFRGLNLLHLTDGYGRKWGIPSLKQQEDDRVLDLLHGVNPTREIFLFCASIDAVSLGYGLREKGYQILGLLDNKPALNGTIQKRFPVFGPEKFSSRDREHNRNCIVIVCHQSMEVFDHIARQLMQYGLSRVNIKHSKPAWSLVG